MPGTMVSALLELSGQLNRIWRPNLRVRHKGCSISQMRSPCFLFPQASTQTHWASVSPAEREGFIDSLKRQILLRHVFLPEDRRPHDGQVKLTMERMTRAGKKPITTQQSSSTSLYLGRQSHVASGQASKEGQSTQVSDVENQHSKKRGSSLCGTPWHIFYPAISIGNGGCMPLMYGRCRHY